MVEEVFVEGEEVERSVLPFETDPPRQWIMSEGNTLDCTLQHDLIADLCQQIVQCLVVEGLDMDHLASLSQIPTIYHQHMSRLGEHDQGIAKGVGDLFFLIFLCLLLPLRLIVSPHLCCIVFSLLLCRIRCLVSRVMNLLRKFLPLFIWSCRPWMFPFLSCVDQVSDDRLVVVQVCCLHLCLAKKSRPAHLIVHLS